MQKLLRKSLLVGVLMGRRLPLGINGQSHIKITICMSKSQIAIKFGHAYINVT